MIGEKVNSLPARILRLLRAAPMNLVQLIAATGGRDPSVSCAVTHLMHAGFIRAVDARVKRCRTYRFVYFPEARPDPAQATGLSINRAPAPYRRGLAGWGGWSV